MRCYGHPVVTLIWEADAAVPIAQAVCATSRVPLCNVEKESASRATRGLIARVEVAHVPVELPNVLCPTFGTEVDALRGLS